MFSVQHVEYFLKQSKELTSAQKGILLTRAYALADDRGIITAGNSENLWRNPELQKQFETFLVTDTQMLNISSELSKRSH